MKEKKLFEDLCKILYSMELDINMHGETLTDNVMQKVLDARKVIHEMHNLRIDISQFAEKGFIDIEKIYSKEMAVICGELKVTPDKYWTLQVFKQ